jgi:hypothetical protein
VLSHTGAIQRPNSDSFLVREKEGLVYKVIENGNIVTNPSGFKVSNYSSNLGANLD